MFKLGTFGFPSLSKLNTPTSSTRSLIFFFVFLSLPGIYTIIVHLAQLSDGEIAFWGLDEDGYSGSFTSFSSLQSYQGESPLSKT